MISVSMIPVSPDSSRTHHGEVVWVVEMADLKRVGDTTSAMVPANSGKAVTENDDGGRRGILKEKPVVEADPGGGRRPLREKNQNLYET